MEIPSWAGKVATVAGLANPITAPIVIGKWVADKAASALGPKSEAPAPVQPQAPPPPPPAPPAPPKPLAVDEKPGEIKPNYTADPKTQSNGNQKLIGADGKWNGADILNGQTQISKSDPSKPSEQENRCGPSAVLASQVMRGKDATSAMAGKLAGQYPEGSNDRKEIEGIQGRIKDGSATHDDLSRMQHFMYQKYHNGKEAGLTPAQLTQMEKDLTPVNVPNNLSKLSDYDNGAGRFRATDPNAGVEESPDNMKSRLDKLPNGQSFVQFVDTNGDNKANHFILMGKDENGRSYTYDPMPKTNQPQVIYQDTRPKAYATYADGSMGVQREGDKASAQLVAGGTLN